MSALNSLVSEAIDLVVHCRRGPGGPRRDRGGRRRGPRRCTRRDAVHHHRAVHPARARRARWPGRATAVTPGPGVRRGRARPVRAARRGAPRANGCRSDRRCCWRRSPATASTCAYTAAPSAGVVSDWATAAAGARPADRPAPVRHRAGEWLTQAGLGDVQPGRVLGGDRRAVRRRRGHRDAAVRWRAPGRVIGAFAATFPVGDLPPAPRRPPPASPGAWPRLIDEIRILTVSAGRSIPQALFEVGSSRADELRPAFDAGAPRVAAVHRLRPHRRPC